MRQTLTLPSPKEEGSRRGPHSALFRRGRRGWFRSPADELSLELLAVAEPVLHVPFGPGFFAAAFAEFVRRWEILQAVERAAAVEDHALVGHGLAAAAVLHRAQGIEQPTAADDARLRLLWVEARPQRPQDFPGIVGVHVVVDDDEQPVGTAHFGQLVDGARHVVGLLLMDGDDVAAERHQVGGPANGNARFLQPADGPDRAQRQHEGITGPMLQRRAAVQDGVVAVIERLDVDDRLGGFLGLVVASPFAEGTLHQVLGLGREHLAFDGDLGTRGNRQAGSLPFDDRHRLAREEAGVVVLGLGPRQAVGRAAAEEDQRFGSKGYGDRGWLALFPILLHDAPAVALGLGEDGDGLRVVHLHAVGTDVHEAVLGVLVNDGVARADVGPAVKLVPDRHGEARKVDVVAGLDVFENGPAVHNLGGYGIVVVPVLLEHRHELLFGGLGVHAQGEPAAAGAAANVGGDAPAMFVTRDVVEQQSGAVVLQRNLGNSANLQVGAGALNGLQLAELACSIQEAAQV